MPTPTTTNYASYVSTTNAEGFQSGQTYYAPDGMGFIFCKNMDAVVMTSGMVVLTASGATAALIGQPMRGLATVDTVGGSNVAFDVLGVIAGAISVPQNSYFFALRDGIYQFVKDVAAGIGTGTLVMADRTNDGKAVSFGAGGVNGKIFGTSLLASAGNVFPCRVDC